VQLVLPLRGERWDALDAATDRVRDRFGTSSVTRASLSGGDRGLAPWLAPE
jgi:DNA polymerase-4